MDVTGHVCVTDTHCYRSAEYSKILQFHKTIHIIQIHLICYYGCDKCLLYMELPLC